MQWTASCSKSAPEASSTLGRYTKTFLPCMNTLHDYGIAIRRLDRCLIRDRPCSFPISTIRWQISIIFCSRINGGHSKLMEQISWMLTLTMMEYLLFEEPEVMEDLGMPETLILNVTDKMLPSLAIGLIITVQAVLTSDNARKKKRSVPCMWFLLRKKNHNALRLVGKRRWVQLYLWAILLVGGVTSAALVRVTSLSRHMHKPSCLMCRGKFESHQE